jgi:hypothetical protein
MLPAHVRFESATCVAKACRDSRPCTFGASASLPREPVPAGSRQRCESDSPGFEGIFFKETADLAVVGHVRELAREEYVRPRELPRCQVPHHSPEFLLEVPVPLGNVEVTVSMDGRRRVEWMPSTLRETTTEYHPTRAVLFTHPLSNAGKYISAAVPRCAVPNATRGIARPS